MPIVFSPSRTPRYHDASETTAPPFPLPISHREFSPALTQLLLQCCRNFPVRDDMHSLPPLAVPTDPNALFRTRASPVFQADMQPELRFHGAVEAMANDGVYQIDQETSIISRLPRETRYGTRERR
ncbi:hypothetical protein AJ80_02290 [Polytolypa hystricis UAMH7299]|uniref:Uncharacterized protein n=1 Tax=Polytolypa hystricis (strain UAMH7299) TaxID=1447883 RepID=A0A2B7YHX5_POLH7|nr:hypothetical protein AJ80_02290 [Polytolypa hystricis UAMH7299]